MKTSIIQLQNHDDVILIKDKMAWHTSQKVILVWPKRGRILTSELDLLLLEREARSLGSKIALVTHHAVIREWAEAISIPVFASIAAAEKNECIEPNAMTTIKKFPMGVDAILEKRKKIPPIHKSRPNGLLQKTIAMLVCAVALVSMLLVLVPTAEITYYPQVRLQEIDIEIKVSDVYTGVNPSGSIPGIVHTVEMSGELSRPSSGKTIVPSTKANGSVTFTNLTMSTTIIPIGTIVQTSSADAIQFVTVEEVAVPAGIGETIDCLAEAILSGSEGNVAPDEILIIAGEIGTQVSVNNLEGFTGGGGIETPSPNEHDYAVLKNQLLDNLLQQGLSSLQADTGKGTVLIEESLNIDAILVEEQVNKINTPSDEAVLRMTVIVKGLTYQESDLRAVASLALTSSQPEGLIPLDDSINMDQIGLTYVDDFGQVVLTMKTSRLLMPEWNPESATNKLAGKKISDADSIFSSLFSQSQPAKFKMITRWWPRLPFLPTQIRFINGASS